MYLMISKLSLHILGVEMSVIINLLQRQNRKKGNLKKNCGSLNGSFSFKLVFCDYY